MAQQSKHEEDLINLINHVFLPPQLPQSADRNCNSSLIEAAIHGLLDCRDALPPACAKAVEQALIMLHNLKATYLSDDVINEKAFVNILCNLKDGDSTAALIIEQNAAQMISRVGEKLIVEQFEVSPSNEAVYETPGRLVRSFPASAVAIDRYFLTDNDFTAAFAATVSTLNTQQVSGMQPRVNKAGKSHDEVRDTTRPDMITNFFVSVLRGIGEVTEVTTISKNTREEILCKSAKLPWRRAPIWLVIRVCLQLVITRALSSGGGHELYKLASAHILCRIMKISAWQHLSMDLRYFTILKVSRRLHKLRIRGLAKASELAQSMQVIESFVRSAYQHLSCEWSSLQAAGASLNLKALATLNFVADTHMTLAELDARVACMRSRMLQSSARNFQPESHLLTIDNHTIPDLSHPSYSADGDYAIANLDSVELWVTSHCETWWQTREAGQACAELFNLQQSYHDKANAVYAGNPEGISRMILTLFEIWIHIDRAALNGCALLGDYGPDIDFGVVHSLLLPSMQQLDRLQTVEEYMRNRVGVYTAQLYDAAHPHSFANRYYDRSPSQKLLMDKIMEAETAKRNQKIEELRQLKAEYDRLSTLVENEAEHATVMVTFTTRYGITRTESRHSSKCQKCVYEKAQKKLTIDIFEDFLPLNKIVAKSIVFELDVPTFFAAWRAARFHMVCTVLGSKSLGESQKDLQYALAKDRQLGTGKYLQRRLAVDPVELRSSVKSVQQSHYSGKSIQLCTEASVCSIAGTRYQYWDKYNAGATVPFTASKKVEKACTYRCISAVLDPFLRRPSKMPDGLPPNCVVARQDLCPHDMTLEQFRDLCDLPLGRHIQWSKILLQLRCPTVDLKSIDTSMFFWQCAHQTGPGHLHNLRDAHEIVNDNFFASELLAAITDTHNRIKDSWESAQALLLLIVVAVRVFAINKDFEDEVLTFLSLARATAKKWVQSLRESMHKADTDQERSNLRWKSCEVALICTTAFAVMDDRTSDTIFRDANNVATLLQMSDIIRENESAIDRTSHTGLLHLRFKLLLHRSHRTVSKNETGLDIALSGIWNGYRAADFWSQVVGAPGWVVQHSRIVGHQSCHQVHVNLLSGEILVNGNRLSRLPLQYEQQSLYKTLFGRAVLETGPSTISGYTFSTKQAHHGFDVSLCMPRMDQTAAGELVVRIDSRRHGSFESIDPALFRSHTPDHFADQYMHWLRVDGRKVVLIPLEEPWNFTLSSQIWHLDRLRDGTWQLSQGHMHIIGLRSNTAVQVAQSLAPLTLPSHIHCMLDSASGCIAKIELPHLRLSFYLRSGTTELVSRDYKMIVDGNQALGTLTGLVNKLVLISKDDSSRIVLIPQSKVTWQAHKSHTQVHIDRCAVDKVHALSVNHCLQQLQIKGDHSSILFMAKLHAVTSSCLPDDLSGRTGTERAIDLLQSAAMWSFEQLSQNDMDNLRTLDAISPRRAFYPKYLQVMQTVTWDPCLGFFAQHDLFSDIVERIIEHAKRQDLFYSESQLSSASHGTDLRLRQRSLQYSSSLRTSGYGAELFDARLDKLYCPRDAVSDHSHELVTNITKTYLRNDQKRSFAAPAANGIWIDLAIHAEINGVQHERSMSSMKYDASILSSSNQHLIDLLPLIRLMISAEDSAKYAMLWWFATSSFAKKANIALLQTLLLFRSKHHLINIAIPLALSFKPNQGCVFKPATIATIVTDAVKSFEVCPEYTLQQEQDEDLQAYWYRRATAWQVASRNAIALAKEIISAQWPAASVTLDDRANMSSYIDIWTIEMQATEFFEIWYNNLQLNAYLNHVSTQIRSALLQPLPAVIELRRLVADQSEHVQSFISTRNVFSRRPPAIKQNAHPLDKAQLVYLSSAGPETTLSSFLYSLKMLSADSAHERRYAVKLSESQTALRSRALSSPAHDQGLSEGMLVSYLHHCERNASAMYASIFAILRDSSSLEELVHGPRISPETILSQLNRTQWASLPTPWRRAITDYGIALTRVQRASRMKAAEKEGGGSLLQEFGNSGHQNWDPRDFPDSLLMEIESNILIREPQEDIAAQMRYPLSNANAVMKMNMGEGKSSTIVPIISAALADGTQLVRVLSGKAQFMQMAQMLTLKLGGLVGRRLYRMPFSRNLAVTHTQAHAILAMLEECVQLGGVLLVQPEHVLSTQLMVAESLFQNAALSRSLAAILRLFETSRDLVDEADDIFSVEYELVYTMGEQQPVDMSPDRWLVIFELLKIVSIIASDKMAPAMVQIKSQRAGSFPLIKLLQTEADGVLLEKIVLHICAHGIIGLPIHRQTHTIREMLRRYISVTTLAAQEVNDVESGDFWSSGTKDTLLLLRGLLAKGVLIFALRKRWRVNYGLAPDRIPSTRLAVPFKAKDSPSLRSEFSQTDLVIVLTALSTYHGGLSDEIMFATMRHLLDRSNADIEYKLWTRPAVGLSSSFRQLSGVNLQDRLQCIGDVFPHLNRVKEVVDYYLTHLVFPKEMRGFPQKIACSGWDLGKKKAALVTGFSGTSDSSILLPLEMQQLELDAHVHTDALVLSHILQPSTGIELMKPNDSSSLSDTEHLLQSILHFSPPVEVILDVGAQILEMNNRQLAETWLARHNSTKGKEAVIFVNDRDEVCIIDREGRCELWATSHYQTSAHLCLVYLDEAHTRGIDLRLPPHYRAAVTLAPRLTKDKLMQACMRMRKLASGQSVVFCVPTEVQGLILSTIKKSDATHIKVEDVLLWAINETHVATRRHAPLWALQGSNFYESRAAWDKLRSNTGNQGLLSSAQSLLKTEAQTLEQSYHPKRSGTINADLLSPTVNSAVQKQILGRCEDIDAMFFDDAILQQQQERELAPEIERQREVQKAESATFSHHKMHQDIVRFAADGIVREMSTAYSPAFLSLGNTSISKLYDLSKLAGSGKLLASEDFVCTIKPSMEDFQADAYQRAVQWLLVSRKNGTDEADVILIISSFEANILLPSMRDGKQKTSLHIYKARCNPGYRSLHNLDLYAVSNQKVPLMPMNLIVELGLFSGQLYFSSNEEYLAFCKHYGLATQQITEEMEAKGHKIDKTGFILSDSYGRIGGESGLLASPVHFFTQFLSRIRRGGESISRTQMGMLLGGRLLQPQDFDSSNE